MRSIRKTVDANGAEAARPSNERLTKRQLQAIETKNKIYDAAVMEFNRKGFNNVSIEDITKAAKVAKGSFYTHFQSKEDLVLYSYTRADVAYQKAYEESEGQDFLNRMISFLQGYYAEFETCGKELEKAVISSYYAFPCYNHYHKDRVLLQCFGRIVDQGKAEGKLDPDIPTNSYVNMLLSALIGIEVLWCFDESGMNMNELLCESMRTMAQGMMQRFAEKRA